MPPAASERDVGHLQGPGTWKLGREPGNLTGSGILGVPNGSAVLLEACESPEAVQRLLGKANTPNQVFITELRYSDGHR